MCWSKGTDKGICVTIDDLIEKWWGKPGGQEHANFHPFMADLCEVMGLDRPGAAEKGKLGAYEYEASVPGGSFRSLKGTGAIDLYKRGHFIMEAKQSYLKPEQASLDLTPNSAAPQAPSGARYDKLMRDARLQAENYAKNLPANEPVAPFVIVCDVGRAFEIYVDTAGNGRGYQFFPDKQSYRLELPDLRDPEKLDQLKAIWTNPRSIDPRFQSADVTRGVAETLAEVMAHLEDDQKYRIKTETDSAFRSNIVEETSLFLMRILFCMFAEDVDLLPKKSFQRFLQSCLTPDPDVPGSYLVDDNRFKKGLEDIWRIMSTLGGERFHLTLNDNIRYFNGNLFEVRTTYRVSSNDLEKLVAAAKSDWRKVEPAIFGTLLEQALDEKERAKLGAHYTPRPYVETLVRATIMDVLEPEWETIEELPEADILSAAEVFHERLATIRVLDPACGTGNFLYVAMELIQALESRVIERIETLGGNAEPRIGPHQFHGMELNPRAAKIAELVLWIGWLRNRLKDDPDAVPEPVLARTANINFGKPGRYDALLQRTETGEPDLTNPQMAEWPEVEFIVGNPPFIGGKDIRERLGGEYAEALWKANPRVPKSADFVMQWWDRAAHTLVADGSPLIRFGYVTTNSITQEFSRRVITNYLAKPQPLSLKGEGGAASAAEGVGVLPPANAEPPPQPLPGGEGLSIIMAIPDHPWTKATKDAAAVRIAMSVAERSTRTGRLFEVVGEAHLDSDNPVIGYAEADGQINANLTVGASVSLAKPLLANEGLSSRGVGLFGADFLVLPEKARELGYKKRKGSESYFRQYRHGRDLMQQSRGLMAIDMHGLSEKEVRLNFPEAYEHLLRHIKPVRDRNNRKSRRDNWWLFGELAPAFREYNEGQARYIATVETSKHRIFQFLDAEILPDNKLLAIGSDDAFHLGILQSNAHIEWALRAGGWLGVGNDSVYVKSKIFDPFPFPDPTDAQRAIIADLAEELDETRKLAIAETDKLTMTELYNLREKLRSGDPMSDKDLHRATAARAGIVNRLHEQLDQAVADAYGWGQEWAAGTLGPSEIVARLVALNHERAAEEAEGKIRWLRPDYQIPRFGPKPD